MRRPVLRWLGAPSRASLAATGIGAVMLAVAAGYTPAAWPLGVAGGAALIAGLPGRQAAAGTLAASAAVITAGIGVAAGTLPLPAAAAEGALILAYLLALDLADSRLTGGSLQWIRSRGPVLAAGFASALLTAAAAEAAFPAAPWLVVAGVAAAGAALLVAAA
ncbi:MAG TPA: hypothetical protein VMV92_23135 [Streptosporangiaceae bacterium]|nr:hypothetical protein [Streptosporangiaceae bacterium]